MKDSVEYNENLAQFVGVEGAKWYLRTKYGADSKELQSYLTSMEEDEVKSNFMLQQAKFLDTIYSSFEPTMSVKEKLLLKKKSYLLIWERARQLELKSDAGYADRVLRRIARSGNTVFLQYTRYQAKQDDFYDEFELCRNDLNLFVKTMVGKYGI